MAMKKSVPAPNPDAYVTALSGWQLVTVEKLRATVLACAGFYRAVFTSLGLPNVVVEGKGFFYAHELFVDKADGDVFSVHLASVVITST